MSNEPKKPESDKVADPAKQDQALTKEELDKVSGGKGAVVVPKGFVQIGAPSFVQVQSDRPAKQGEASAPKRSIVDIYAGAAADVDREPTR